MITINVNGKEIASFGLHCVFHVLRSHGKMLLDTKAIAVGAKLIV